jgi:hypothetical protein
VQFIKVPEPAQAQRVRSGVEAARWRDETCGPVTTARDALPRRTLVQTCALGKNDPPLRIGPMQRRFCNRRKSLTRFDNYKSDIATLVCTSMAPLAFSAGESGSKSGRNPKEATVSTLESRKVNRMATRPCATAPLSRRARFDLATLVIAGAASTVFFLLPVWAPLDRSVDPTAAETRPALTLASGPAVDSTNATLSALATVDVHRPTPRVRRTTTRSAQPPRPAPAIVQPTAAAKVPQSKLARLLLGDGSERVQPFPRPASRSDR